MTQAERKVIQDKIDQALKNIEEIRKARAEYQNSLNQLDINEAGWMGASEILKTLLEELPEYSEEE